MKKAIFFSLTLFLFHAAFAQNDKYVNAMKKNISMLDSAAAKNNALELANNFQRIGDAEKTQWLPYYYAAYLTSFQALITPDVTAKDELADKATSLLETAQKILNKENSEIDVIRAMIATAHMTVDPQNRYMQYGNEISQAIQKAEELDSTNPRPVLFQAQSVFHTPQTFGGGKDAAKPLFEKAEKLFATFKPANELSPNWGRDALEYYMKNYK